MKSSRRKQITRGWLSLCLALMVSGCVLITDQGLPQMTGQDTATSRTEDGRLREVELQSALLAFADSYMERVAQAVDSMVQANPDAQVESLLKGTKVIYVSSALTIAAEPDVGQGLLDMMVMVGLQRRVWQQGWPGLLTPEQSVEMYRALQRLESDLLQLARRVMTAEQLNALEELIDDWRERNPTQLYVAYVRFGDFDETGLKQRFSDALIQQGGLLAPVREAVQEIEQIKMLSERGIFLANHFPIVMEWHLEHLFAKVMVTAPVSRALEDGHRLSLSSELLSTSVARLPEQLTQERAALMMDLAERIALERRRTLEQLALLLAEERQRLFSDVNDMNEPMTALLAQMEQTGKVLRDTASAIERIVAPGPEGEESGWVKMERLMGQISSGAGELNTLAASLERLTSGTVDTATLTLLEQALDGYTQRLALYIAGLMLLFFALLAGVLLLAQRGRAGSNPR